MRSDNGIVEPESQGTCLTYGGGQKIEGVPSSMQNMADFFVFQFFASSGQAFEKFAILTCQKMFAMKFSTTLLITEILIFNLLDRFFGGRSSNSRLSTYFLGKIEKSFG